VSSVGWASSKVVEPVQCARAMTWVSTQHMCPHSEAATEDLLQSCRGYSGSQMRWRGCYVGSGFFRSPLGPAVTPGIVHQVPLASVASRAFYTLAVAVTMVNHRRYPIGREGMSTH